MLSLVKLNLIRWGSLVYLQLDIPDLGVLDVKGSGTAGIKDVGMEIGK